jgi:hypothetical protein
VNHGSVAPGREENELRLPSVIVFQEEATFVFKLISGLFEHGELEPCSNNPETASGI